MCILVSSAIIKTELKEHKSWFLGWFIGIFGFGLAIIGIYPGEEGMESMLDLIDNPVFEALLGTIEGEAPSYALFQSMMSPFLGMVFAIFGILFGVRIAMKSISDNTGELINTLPVTRSKMLFNKIMAGLIFGFILLLSWAVPLLIPINGNSIGAEIVLSLSWWAMLYLLMSIMLGVLLGNITGSSGKGALTGILFILFMFIFQTLINFQSKNLIKTELWEYVKNDETVIYTLYNLIMDINLVTWFSPSAAILGYDIDMKYVWIITAALIIFGALSFLSYNRKDLIDERGIFSRKKKQKLVDKVESDDQSHVKAKKSVKKSFYTFWVRPLEKRFPFTADIVYSDRRALMVLYIAIIMFYPLQLFIYLGDTDSVDAPTVFGGGGLMAIFTYGYDMSLYPPWMWWVVTQVIGASWVLFLPMVVRWIRSVPARDGEDGTGDLVGSLPVMKRSVVFQRLLGVFLEMVWAVFWLVLWYVISVSIHESRVGEILVVADPANEVVEEIFLFDNPLTTGWVVIALVSMIPLYMFLTTIGVAITLFFKKRGLQYAKYMIYIIVLLFIIAFSLGNPDLYWLSGIMGMYNPIGIMIEQSFAPGEYGVFWLIGLTIASLFLVRLNTRKFTWLKQETKEIVEE